MQRADHRNAARQVPRYDRREALVMALIAPNFIRELDPNAASSGR